MGKAPKSRMPETKVPAWGPSLRTGRDEEAKTLASRTARRLRSDIVQNRFQPGERLQFDKLGKLYDVGTSPLREALFQVAAQGLVIAEDHKGFVVAPIQLEEMLDVSNLRAYLESYALKESIRRGDNDWEVDLVAALHRLKMAGSKLRSGAPSDMAAATEWELRHREFHFALCKACGSPWLLHFFEELYDQLERYRRYFWRYAERAIAADSEHEAIMRAAIKRDEARAINLLQAHFRKQAQLTMKLRHAVAPKPESEKEPRREPESVRSAS